MKRTRTIGIPLGFEVREESKRVRRSFVLRESVYERFKEIANNKGTNPNALLNDILLTYVNEERRKSNK